MLYIISRWFIVALSLLVAAWIIPGVSVSSFYIALITAVLLGLANTIIRPILILLTLPITILTLGLFVLIINGLLFWFIASFVQGFEVNGFFPALGGALVVSFVSLIGNKLLKSQYEQDESERSQII